MSDTPLLSTLVRDHLPEFVRADYATFVAFIEAYYAYLEQTNKGTDFGKHLLQYSDVDRTLTEFEEHFSRSFLPLIPTDLIADKPALIKHAKKFYASKGSEKSFKFFFRALYGEEIEVVIPKNFVLRASDGHYSQGVSLRCENNFFTTATGNGILTTFQLAEIIATANDFSVYFDNVLQSSAGYTTSVNAATVTFTTAPSNGVVIKFLHNTTKTFLAALNSSTQSMGFVGTTSLATAVLERATSTIIGNLGTTEFSITQTSVPLFVQGELITAKYWYSNAAYLTLTFKLQSILQSITVVDGGANYNIGDPVIVSSGNPTVAASAAVESVYTAVIAHILVLRGGAGFIEGDFVNILSTPNTGLVMAASDVDTSEFYHANSISINSDIISLYENVAANAVDYGFPVGGAENQNTKIADALSYGGVSGLGPLQNVEILVSLAEFATLPLLDMSSPKFLFTSNTAASTTANGVIQLVNLGVLGRMNVVSGGAGYVVGDELIFTNITSNAAGYGTGWGAAATVTGVHSANSGIQTVKFQPPRIDGTVSTGILSVIVTGTGTHFEGDLSVGDRIEIGGQSRYINTISSNTSLNVNVAWSSTSTNKKMGVYDRTFVGGEQYRQDYLPTITVLSSNVSAYGASVIVEAIYGDGETLLANSPFSPGRVRSIVITNRGSGYTNTPLLSLTGKGNGLSTAIAELFLSRFVYPGKFLTTDSLVSSDRRIQNQDYYQNFSYVVQSRVDFSRYKQILLDLLHPSGMKLFAEYMVDEELIDTNSLVVGDTLKLERTLSGTVNVANGSVSVTGTGTTFNVANTLTYLTIGGSIVVNSESRVISTIINNTSLTVASTFDHTANAQTYITIKSA